MVDQTLRTLPEYYQNITIDNYIIMPNHHNHDNNNPINRRENHAPIINHMI